MPGRQLHELVKDEIVENIHLIGAVEAGANGGLAFSEGIPGEADIRAPHFGRLLPIGVSGAPGVEDRIAWYVRFVVEVPGVVFETQAEVQSKITRQLNAVGRKHARAVVDMAPVGQVVAAGEREIAVLRSQREIGQRVIRRVLEIESLLLHLRDRAGIVLSADGERAGEVGESTEADVRERTAVAEGVPVPDIAAVVGKLPIILVRRLRSVGVGTPADRPRTEVQLNRSSVLVKKLGVELLRSDVVVEIGIPEAE